MKKNIIIAAIIIALVAGLSSCAKVYRNYSSSNITPAVLPYELAVNDIVRLASAGAFIRHMEEYLDTVGVVAENIRSTYFPKFKVTSISEDSTEVTIAQDGKTVLLKEIREGSITEPYSIRTLSDSLNLCVIKDSVYLYNAPGLCVDMKLEKERYWTIKGILDKTYSGNLHIVATIDTLQISDYSVYPYYIVGSMLVTSDESDQIDEIKFKSADTYSVRISAFSTYETRDIGSYSLVPFSGI